MKIKWVFLQNRYIGENLVSLNAIIQYMNDTNQEGIIISFDFEKAFDTVEWAAIQNALSYFNFGKTFRHMIGAMYKGSMANVQNNDFCLKCFPLTRGLKQGNPLSPYLFLIVIETLAIELRAHPKIETIEIWGRKKLLGQYADVLWTFIKFKQEFFTSVLAVLQDFYKRSGLQINYDKTEVMCLGSLRNSDAKL